MSNALPVQLRERLVAAYKSGEFTYRKIASIFGVGEATVSRLLARERKTGDVDPSNPGGGNPPRIPPSQYDALRALVVDAPDATQQDLCDLWEELFGVSVSKAAMGRTLMAAGITRKKSSSAPRSRRVPTSSRPVGGS
jgi:transposase